MPLVAQDDVIEVFKIDLAKLINSAPINIHTLKNGLFDIYDDETETIQTIKYFNNLAVYINKAIKCYHQFKSNYSDLAKTLHPLAKPIQNILNRVIKKNISISGNLELLPTVNSYELYELGIIIIKFLKNILNKENAFDFLSIAHKSITLKNALFDLIPIKILDKTIIKNTLSEKIINIQKQLDESPYFQNTLKLSDDYEKKINDLYKHPITLINIKDTREMLKTNKSAEKNIKAFQKEKKYLELPDQLTLSSGDTIEVKNILNKKIETALAALEAAQEIYVTDLKREYQEKINPLRLGASLISEIDQLKKAKNMAESQLDVPIFLAELDDDVKACLQHGLISSYEETISEYEKRISILEKEHFLKKQQEEEIENSQEECRKIIKLITIQIETKKKELDSLSKQEKSRLRTLRLCRDQMIQLPKVRSKIVEVITEQEKVILEDTQKQIKLVEMLDIFNQELTSTRSALDLSNKKIIHIFKSKEKNDLEIKISSLEKTAQSTQASIDILTLQIAKHKNNLAADRCDLTRTMNIDIPKASKQFEEAINRHNETKYHSANVKITLKSLQNSLIYYKAKNLLKAEKEAKKTVSDLTCKITLLTEQFQKMEPIASLVTEKYEHLLREVQKEWIKSDDLVIFISNIHLKVMNAHQNVRELQGDIIEKLKNFKIDISDSTHPYLNQLEQLFTTIDSLHRKHQTLEFKLQKFSSQINCDLNDLNQLTIVKNEFTTKLDLYESYRSHKYWLKDLFSNKDKISRHIYIQQLKQALREFECLNLKPETLLEKINEGIEKFPTGVLSNTSDSAKNLRGILLELRAKILPTITHSESLHRGQYRILT